MRTIVKEKNSSLGYSFPFEGEKHLATLIILPYREDTWRESALPALEEYLSLVKAISQFERVVVIIDPRISYQTVKNFQLPNVTILRLYSDDSWARDTLPVFLKDQKDDLLGVDFGFNSWGGDFNGLYKPWDLDNAIGRKVLLELKIPRLAEKDFILEGGSIHTDGEGTLLTTSECLLSKGRNPNLTQSQIEDELEKTLNIQKVLFLPFGIYEDETSGHVDNIACFLKPGTVLLSWTDDKNDPQYDRSLKDLEYLESVTDAKGRKLEIIKMPLPSVQYLSDKEASGIKIDGKAIERKGGRRLAASYVNFYMGQDFIILPQFHDAMDEKAVTILDSFYLEKKKIIPFYSKEILLGGGNLHCVTKQIPYSDLYVVEPKENEK